MPKFYRNIFKLSLILTSVFVFSSCEVFEELVFKGIEDVNVREFSQKGIDVEIKAKIFNPNAFNIKIVDSDLDFYVAGTKIGGASIDDNIKIHKKLEKDYSIRLKAAPDQLKLGLATMMQILFTGKASVRVKGNIKARALAITKSVPVDFEQTIGI